MFRPCQWFLLIVLAVHLKPVPGMWPLGGSSQSRGRSDPNPLPTTLHGNTSRVATRSNSQGSDYDPSGENPCVSRTPTAAENAACQGLCDDSFGISAPRFGGGPWTIGQCKKQKCKCKFNYSGFTHWVSLTDKIATRGDPKKLGQLVIDRYADAVRRGAIYQDLSDPLLR